MMREYLDFDGKYRVYTNATIHSQTLIVSPTIVTIGGESFLKGGSIDASGSSRYIAVRHIVELVTLEEKKNAHD